MNVKKIFNGTFKSYFITSTLFILLTGIGFYFFFPRGDSKKIKELQNTITEQSNTIESMRNRITELEKIKKEIGNTSIILGENIRDIKSTSSSIGDSIEKLGRGLSEVKERESRLMDDLSIFISSIESITKTK